MDKFRTLLIMISFLNLFGCTSAAYVVALEQTSKNRNVEINHIGKVVDQYNKPVVGAIVKVKIAKGRESILPHVFDKDKDLYDQLRDDALLEMKTDVNGEFKIENAKGFLLVVNSIEREGYIAEKLNNRAVRYEKKKLDSIPIKKTYKIWKSDGVEKVLFRPQTLRLTLKHEQYSDGYPIKLVTYKESPYFEELGHLQIKCFNEGVSENVETFVKYSWWCELSAINGGVQVIADKSRHAAPEGGYIHKLFFGKDKEEEDWRNDSVSTTVYFYNRGKNYGKARVKISAGKNKKIGIYVSETLINPNNSRNLEKHGKNLIHVS